MHHFIPISPLQSLSTALLKDPQAPTLKLYLFLVFLSPHTCSCHWSGNFKSFLSLFRMHPAHWQIQPSPCFTDQRAQFLSGYVYWLALPHVFWLLVSQSLETTIHSLAFMDEWDLLVLILIFFEVIPCNVMISKSILLSTQEYQAELLYPCRQEIMKEVGGLYSTKTID